MKAGRGSAVLVQLIVLYMPSHILFFSHKRGGGALFFRVMAKQGHKISQPRTQGICSWGAKYPGMVWSRDPRILRKMAYCLLGSGE